MRRSHRLLGVLGVSLVLLSSCGEGEGPRAGVGVRSINTNVGLGVELEAVAPATVIAQKPPRRLAKPSSTLPPLEFEIPKPTTRPCPAAGPFDFPDIETGVEPRGRPAEGEYPWKLDGEARTGSGVFEVDIFETRKILNVEDHPSIPGAFTFEEQRDTFIDERQNRVIITTRFRVVPDPAVQHEQVPNDAGKGLFIEGQVTEGKDSEGNDFRQESNFVPAVQLIAFPVKDGTVTNSTGTDPSTAAQLTINGEVKGKKQVDACGDRVDAWFVDAVQNFRYTTENGQTETIETNLDYGVAPQFGGMLVFEHIDQPREGPVFSIDFRVGRVPQQSKG